MKLKNLKIGTMLIVSYLIMLFFVVIIGSVSVIQTRLIQSQTDKIFTHPLTVHHALAEITNEILLIRNKMLNLFPTSNNDELITTLSDIEICKEHIFGHIDVLYKNYLGPRSDVDSIQTTFIVWNSIRDQTIELVRKGEYAAAHERRTESGVDGLQVKKLLKAIDRIQVFATNKGNSLVMESQHANEVFIRQLLIITFILVILTIAIYLFLLQNIRKPLSGLTGSALLFRDGNYHVRNDFQSKNEVGQLSEVFNSLAENIQQNLEMNQKVQDISAMMLSEDEAKRFFHALLSALASKTNSQIAAVYLRSDDEKHYEYFDSIGLDENAIQQFNAEDFSGELGLAVANRSIQHIKNIPGDTRFSFLTVAGKFIPRQMITIPVVAGNDVLAVFSIASLDDYNPQVVRFVEKIWITLSARVAGVLVYRKMKEFSAQLEMQNAELEAQKNELSSQSAELLQQNAELELQKKQLDEASRLKTNFLSNMSHELRTPLNSVIALSGVLNRRLANKIPNDEYSYIEVIERNGKHLLSLINDILDISRIEAGREEIEVTNFDANTLVSEVINLIQPQAQQKGIELLHTDASAQVIMASDAGKVTHILQNLIGNAVKFTEKGQVTVSTTQTTQLIKISVTDTGIGIDPEHLAHIFDEFRQADGSTSRRFGGTGLGLAIAKKYAILLGGAITVKSTSGEGSEFVLNLPVSFNGNNQVLMPEVDIVSKFSRIRPPEKSTNSTGKIILLVEDSQPAIVQMKDILEENNYTIDVATSGTEALEKLERIIPDAIILDLMMPGIDGFEVLRNIRSVPGTANIPVLILTAKHITKEDLKILKGNHIFELIQKGDVNRAELLHIVHQMTFTEMAETRKPEKEKQPIEGKPVVLVVEDNFDNMLTVKALLDMDFTIIEAVNGKEAVVMAKDFIPHLILMDIALPEMDGIEAFRIIRNEARLHHIPIIALTASAMTSDREVILAHGFDAYISKPIDENDFFKTIKRTLYGK